MVRINGLASGMDIDSIVSDMMKIKRMPLDKLNQEKQILEWQRDDYREMNTLLDSLDRTIFDNVSLQKNFIAKKVTSSNDSAVSAVALNSSANVSNSIEVVSLAKPASWKTDSDVNFNDNQDLANFKKVDGTLKVHGNKELNFKVKEPGSPEYKEVKISISAGDSIDTVLSKINNSDLGISAMRASIWNGSVYEDSIVFTSNKTGTGGELVASDSTTNNFLKDLGFKVAEDMNINTDDIEGFDGYKLVPDTSEDKKALDAIVKINGYQIAQSSNNFTLNGIQYTLKDKGTSNISTTTDVDTVFNSIKTFVDKYNEVLEKIQGELKEERFRSFHPLSDEEQEAMTEKQAEKWEEKARSGLLRNDSILSRALSTMRTNLYTPVDGLTSSFTHLSQIGIKTSTNYREGGKLVLDEAKLKEAINQDPNAIYQLFSSDGKKADGKIEEKNHGLARRLRDSLKNSMENLVEKAGSSTKTNSQFTIGKLLTSVTSQIDRYEVRMQDLESRYYRQFSAMEKMIQQANSQSMSLMSYFS